ncbi:PREDICTED: homeobox protein 5-like [Polistes canadensis]|uniref:homeobox protein 5-like n=1 Tax=Polistes canadensis TaxID=91411 RepID=UPI000718FC23|nr:PREDICTED: homeobox protein 5-like [Polistes canadensis]
MLHSTLPRAFLAPGLNYFGYYGEEVHHPYAAPQTSWHIPTDNAANTYGRISEQHQTVLRGWESSRPSTPCPLDLSLKAPVTPNTPRTTTEDAAIEVDDEEDRRIREEAQRRAENRKYRTESESVDPLLIEEIEIEPQRSSSAHSQRSYDRHLASSKENGLHVQEVFDKARFPDETTTRLPPPYPNNDAIQKYHQLQNQKLLLNSPTRLQSIQSYHQQLLLTPQHHFQSIHAPMTPPSTPSPPQCPRRKTREEDVSSPSSSMINVNVTPRQNVSSEKPTPRPKKKHARRLKFDEDTSSPVSGTVILGPDEAVVTGDIDPAFNIVEVTEEARAELAKIENRLGPYQCKLCRQLHEDAFQLAQHRCSRIAHVEYKCPECDKRFSCPANLASHRRWHKPRLPNGESITGGSNSSTPSTNTTTEISCTRCDAKFSRQAALRKHIANQHPENVLNANINSNSNSSTNSNSSNNTSNNNNNNNNTIKNITLDDSETASKLDSSQLGIQSLSSNVMP